MEKDKENKIKSDLKKFNHLLAEYRRIPKFDYKHIFEILEKKFPDWTSLQDIRRNVRNTHPEDMNRLVEEGFLHKVSFLMGGTQEEPISEDRYRLLPEGFNYLNNVRSKRTNDLLFWLTIILMIFGVIQIGLTIVQIYFQIK